VISALGDAHVRARLGFPGGGPRLVLSPLGVFDFDEQGDMRVRSLHAGVKPDDVRDATAFDLHVPDDPPRTEPPTDDELAQLRERVDVHGTLSR
jgi:glutaconate CoA-transferase subunit B